MSNSNASLDDLRIHRGAVSRSSHTPWIVAVLLILLAAGSTAWWWSRGPSPIVVKTELARAQSSGGQRTLLNASGYVTARRTATVSSKVMGKVIELNVEEGMKVEAGQAKRS